MEKIQADWLDGLTKANNRQKQLDARELKKQALAEKLAQDRELQTGTLISGTAQRVVKSGKQTSHLPGSQPEPKGRKKKGKDQFTLDYLNHDQTEEFDLDEQRDGYSLTKGLESLEVEDWDPLTGTQEQFQKHLAAARVVDQMVLQMEQATCDELDDDGNPVLIDELDDDGNPVFELDKEGNQVFETDKEGNQTPKRKKVAKQRPLFEPEEIASEVYDPLKRRGLVPETNIPDKYSRTKEMLTGSFAEYAKRVERDKEGSTAKRLFKENFGLAKSFVGMVTQGVGAGEKFAANLKTDAKDLVLNASPGENIKSIVENLGSSEMVKVDSQRMDFVNQSLGFLTDVVYEAGNDINGALQGGEKLPARIANAANIVQGLIAAVAVELGAPFAPSGLGLAVSSMFGSLVKRSDLVALFKQETFSADVVTSTATILADAAKEALTAIEPKDPKDSKLAGVVTIAGTTFAKEFQAAIKADVLAKQIESEEFSQFADAWSKAANLAVKAAVTPEVLKVFESDEAKLHAKSEASKKMEKEFKREEAAKPPSGLKHLATDHQPDWVESESGWVCSQCQVNDMRNPQLLAGILERKINAMKRDAAILKWSTTLVGMGIDLATNFVAPLAIAGSAIKMAKNIYEAAKRTADLAKFIDDQQGMFNAASPFSAPLSQFIHNSGVQAAHYSANAGFEAAKMIGAIVQCVGVVAAPAGAALSTLSSGAQAIEAFLYEAKKRYDLEGAWTTYKAALARPENRKLGLIAMKKNPTLAKYAVAWGAVIKEDPLVYDFMSSCGLTYEALKDPDGGIDKVVEYLELRMPDDNVVTGRVIGGDEKEWVPAKLELTAVSWMSAKSLGESVGGVKPADTRPFEAALLKYEQQFNNWRETAKNSSTKKLDKDQSEACRELLKRLSSGLRSYRCLLADGTVSTKMEQVKRTFDELIQASDTEASGWLVKA